MKDREELKKILDNCYRNFKKNEKPLTIGDKVLNELYIWEMETTELVGDYVLWLN